MLGAKISVWATTATPKQSTHSGMLFCIRISWLWVFAHIATIQRMCHTPRSVVYNPQIKCVIVSDSIVALVSIVPTYLFHKKIHLHNQGKNKSSKNTMVVPTGPVRLTFSTIVPTEPSPPSWSSQHQLGPLTTRVPGYIIWLDAIFDLELNSEKVKFSTIKSW